MLKIISLFFLFIWAVNAFSAGTQGSGNPEKLNNRYLYPVFEAVDVSKDHIYGSSVNENGETESLKFDVYSPAGDHFRKRPLIVWVHGGGFTFGNDKSQKYIVEMANRFARKGFVCVSIDYRIREKPKENMGATISEAIADACKAMKFFRKNRKKLGIDPSRIIIAGGSAGGMLAVNYCYNHEMTTKNDRKGIITLVNLWGSPGQDVSKLTFTAKSIPSFVVHGTADKLVPFSNSEALVSSLKQNHIENEFFIIPGGEHTPVQKMDEFEKSAAQFIYQFL